MAFFSHDIKNYLSKKKMELSCILGGTSKTPKTEISYISQKDYEKFFLKSLDSSIHLFYELNEIISLVYKKIESFLLC